MKKVLHGGEHDVDDNSEQKIFTESDIDVKAEEEKSPAVNTPNDCLLETILATSSSNAHDEMKTIPPIGRTEGGPSNLPQSPMSSIILPLGVPGSDDALCPPPATEVDDSASTPVTDDALCPPPAMEVDDSASTPITDDALCPPSATEVDDSASTPITLPDPVSDDLTHSSLSLPFHCLSDELVPIGHLDVDREFQAFSDCEKMNTNINVAPQPSEEISWTEAIENNQWGLSLKIARDLDQSLDKDDLPAFIDNALKELSRWDILALIHRLRDALLSLTLRPVLFPMWYWALHGSMQPGQRLCNMIEKYLGMPGDHRDTYQEEAETIQAIRLTL